MFWAFIGLIFMIGVILLCYCGYWIRRKYEQKFGEKEKQVVVQQVIHQAFAIKPATRTLSVQSQCTYTSVRGAAAPRFLPLLEHASGAVTN
jgi:hypothetical protein